MNFQNSRNAIDTPHKKYKFVLHLILMVSLTGHTSGDAQSSLEQKVDSAVAQVMQEHDLVGVAVGIMEKGKLLLAKGYGFADLEHAVVVTPETLFQSASIGKMFTATAIMILVNEGRLDLDEAIATYFPGTPEHWHNITVRQLISHTSGLGDYFTSINLQLDYSESDLVKIITQLPMEFSPGSQYRYSNTGYLLAGFIIRLVSGRSRAAFLTERVFGPAGMKTAMVNSLQQIVLNRADSYIDADGTLEKAYWVSPSLSTGADGGLLLSILDMASWDAALYADTVLPQSTLAQMWTTAPLADGTLPVVDYGYGWRSGYVRGHRFVHHRGTFQGFNLKFNRYVDDQLSVIVMTNYGQMAEEIAAGVAGVVNPDLAPYSEIEDADSNLSSAHRDLLLAYFRNSPMAPKFTAEALRRLGGIYQAKVVTGGEFEFGENATLSLVDEKLSEDRRIRTYQVNGESMSPYIVNLRLNSSGLVDNMVFQYDY